MGNFARRIIDAVQNSLMDRLVLRTHLLLVAASLWSKATSGPEDLTAFWVIPTLLILLVLIWLIGAIANRRPRPRTPHDRVHAPPANGFEAWQELPEGGLRPPGIMRRLVAGLAFGRASPSADFLAGVLGLGVLAVLFALAHAPDADWSNIHPALADPTIRVRLASACVALIALVTLRQWAVEQSKRLDPTLETGAPPAWTGWVFAFLVLAVSLSLAAIFFHLPSWSGVAATVAILTLFAILPAWRDRLLDLLFGKREDPLA